MYLTRKPKNLEIGPYDHCLHLQIKHRRKSINIIVSTVNLCKDNTFIRVTAYPLFRILLLMFKITIHIYLTRDRLNIISEMIS